MTFRKSQYTILLSPKFFSGKGNKVNSKPKHNDNKGTWISIYIDAETNILLDEAKSKSCRTKRGECALRLKDHLHEYISIAKEGDRTKRTSKA